MKKRMKKLTAVFCAAALTVSGSAAVSAQSAHLNINVSLGTYGKVLAALVMKSEASWLKNASFDLVATTGEKLGFKLDAILNDVTLTTLFGYSDLENLVLYLDGISSSYMTASLEDLISASGISESIAENMENVSVSTPSTLTAEQIQTLTDDYLPVLVDACEITDGEIKTVEVNDVSNEVTDTHFVTDIEKGASAIQTLAGMILEDEEMLEALKNAGANAQGDLEERLEYLASDEFLQDAAQYQNMVIEGDICLDTDGVFTAIYVNAEDQSTSLSGCFEMPKVESKQALNFEIALADESLVDIDAVLNDGEGEFSVNAEGQSIVSGVYQNESDEKVMKGEMTLLAGDLISSEIGVEGGSLVLDYEMDKDQGVFNGSGTVYVDTNEVVTLSITADKNAEDVEIPEDLTALEPALDMTSETFAEDFSSTLSIFGIIGRLQEAGIDLDTLLGGSGS